MNCLRERRKKALDTLHVLWVRHVPLCVRLCVYVLVCGYEGEGSSEVGKVPEGLKGRIKV